MGFRKPFFGGSFGVVNAPPSGETDWWLAGGISEANCVAAYQPKGAASYAASLTDLSGNENDATEGVTPDWDSTNGWKFDGVDDYLLSVTPSDEYSAIIRFGNVPATNSTRVLFGYAIDTDHRFGFHPTRSSGTHFFAYGNNGAESGSLVTSGIVAVTPGKCYIDGSLDDSFTYTWYSNVTNIFIGKYGSYLCESYVQAFAVYNTDISSYISDLYTAIGAL